MRPEDDVNERVGAAGEPAEGVNTEGSVMTKVIKARRKGNVARLPKEVRQRINEMIEDGFTYREIIEKLEQDGDGLSESNLSRWKEGGYQDWLAERAFIERVRARQETPREMVPELDATEVNHAALQMGTLYIFEALRDLSDFRFSLPPKAPELDGLSLTGSKVSSAR